MTSSCAFHVTRPLGDHFVGAGHARDQLIRGHAPLLQIPATFSRFISPFSGYHCLGKFQPGPRASIPPSTRQKTASICLPRAPYNPVRTRRTKAGLNGDSPPADASAWEWLHSQRGSRKKPAFYLPHLQSPGAHPLRRRLRCLKPVSKRHDPDLPHGRAGKIRLPARHLYNVRPAATKATRAAA